MRYFQTKRLGFYLFILAWISAVVATGGYLLDTAKTADRDQNVVIMCAVALVLPILLEILYAFGLKLDFINLMPIIFVALITFVVGTYLKERVDVLGYIFTDHFSFEVDYPELGVALVGYIASLVLGLLSSFFRQDVR